MTPESNRRNDEDSPTQPLRTADSLPLPVQQRIEQVCLAFEDVWKSGERPLIEPRLGAAAEPERSELLRELLRLELRYRCGQGEQPAEEEYNGRFPNDRRLIDEVFRESLGSGRESLPLGTRVQYFGDYEILGEVGRGGMGIVYKARQMSLNRVVALKMIRRGHLATAEEVERFHREAELAANLQHANIVAVHEVGTHGGLHYYSTDYVEGISLREIIASGPQRPRQAAEYAQVIAGAMHYAHEQGILHRDLKPANVLIDRMNQPRITDFGLAKRLGTDSELTETKQIVGTAAYMSPEQALGASRQADRRSDIYSIGVVLYQLLTGRRPFEETGDELLRQVVNDQPTPPRRIAAHIPRDIEAICLKAIAKCPDHRYATAQDLADDLGRFLRFQPVRARPLRWPLRVWLWSRRNPAAAAAISAAFLGLLVSLWAVSSGRVAGFSPVALRTVKVQTEPPGATVVFYPLDPVTGEPQAENAVHPDETFPIVAKLEPGDYLVVADLSKDGCSFHEVHRRVPGPDEGLPSAYRHLNWNIDDKDGSVLLPTIEIPRETVTAGMARFEGHGRFEIGSPSIAECPPHQRKVAAFWLDTTEVRVADFQLASARNEAFQCYEDGGRSPIGNDAMAYVSYDDAVAYAEVVGKRLPTEWEYEFAATAEGRCTFPWGDAADMLTSWSYGAVGKPEQDRLDMQPPVFGLFSNVAEWTDSLPVPYPKFWDLGVRPLKSAVEDRVVRGGTASVAEQQPERDEWIAGPRARFAEPRYSRKAGLGFRCGRSDKARLRPDDFSMKRPD